nr:MAG TPA: hypothetical protein [Caudoviricetes sp.]
MCETIYEAVENLNDDDLLKMWNEYASDTCMDDYIFGSLAEIAEATGDNAVDFARRIIYGNVTNANAPYWYINGYANIVSADSLGGTPLDIGILTEWVIDNPDKIADYDLDVEEEEE